MNLAVKSRGYKVIECFLLKIMFVSFNLHIYCVLENVSYNVSESMIYQFIVFNVRSVPYQSLLVRKQILLLVRKQNHML